MATIGKRKLNKKTIRLALGAWLSLLLTTVSHAGDLDLPLVPIASEASSSYTAISIPVPDFLIEESALIEVFNQDGTAISARVAAPLFWPKKNRSRFIRSLYIDFDSRTTGPSQIAIRWSGEKVSKTKSDVESYREITHDVQLSKDWLAEAFYTPFDPLDEEVPYGWIDTSLIKSGRFVTSEARISRGKILLTNKAIWLYDRVASLYLVYYKTGDLSWKRKAHQAAIFYKNHISDDGYFELAPKDMKYINSHGLLIDHQFHPDQKNLKIVTEGYERTLSWPTSEKKEGFWTERHHAIALSNAITQWEFFGDDRSLARIKDFVEEANTTLLKHADYGCFVHSYESHEGEKKKADVCSTWMTALLIEQFWRVHHNLHDQGSAEVLSTLGRYIEDHGTYRFIYGGKKSTVPKYLSILNSSLPDENDPWTDLHHACDVAAALTKTAYVQRSMGNLSEKTIPTIRDMLVTCKKSMFRDLPRNEWAVKPIRKFNWWYYGSGSFTWLIDSLEIYQPPR